MVELPFTGLTDLENTPEQVLGILPLNEDILPWSALITESGCDGRAFDPQIHRIVEELRNVFRRFALKQGAIDGNPESLCNCQFYGLNRTVEHAVLTDGSIMPFLQA